MQRYMIHEVLLKNLREEFSPISDPTLYASKEETLKILRELTEQDFGDDIQAWENWFKVTPPNKCFPGLWTFLQ